MAIYSDINIISPTTEPLLYDFQAVYQALITLFNTRPGEVLFNPEYGLDLSENLFDIITDLSAGVVYHQIYNAVTRFEPRVQIDNANSHVIPYPNDNMYKVDLQFSIVGLDNGQNFQLIGNFNSSNVS
jgi:phage baseplate assembly protein W